MAKDNSKKSVVKGIRIKTDSIIYRWWEETDSPSTIVKYILKSYIKNSNTSVKASTSIDNLYSEIDNVLSNQEFEENIDSL